MPIPIVTTNPPGSRPGIRNFATTPTISPNTIQPITLMTHPVTSNSRVPATDPFAVISTLYLPAGQPPGFET